jgi:hypothetical protein
MNAGRDFVQEAHCLNQANHRVRRDLAAHRNEWSCVWHWLGVASAHHWRPDAHRKSNVDPLVVNSRLVSPKAGIDLLQFLLESQPFSHQSSVRRALIIRSFEPIPVRQAYFIVVGLNPKNSQERLVVQRRTPEGLES